jgi:hypothetical protein
MNHLIVVSRCLDISRGKESGIIIDFHFKGVLKGHKIKGLKLAYKGDKRIEKDQDYIMYVRSHMVHKNVLQGQILKIVKINETKSLAC